MKPIVELFTDGSCPANPGPGGWAYILRIKPKDTEKRDSGGDPSTTNNRMELMGVIQALKVLEIRSCDVTLYSDSQYVTKGISEWMPGWKKKGWKRYDHELKIYQPVLNSDLWQEINRLISIHDFKTVWVRGHNGHPENEECDVAAGEATKRIMEQMKSV
jgi:ribonuclease HI